MSRTGAVHSFSLACLSALWLTACGGTTAKVFPDPLPTTESASKEDLVSRFETVYPPGPNGMRQAGVIAPRFGLPTFSVPDGSFPIELVSREVNPTIVAALVSPSVSDVDAARCLSAADSNRCVPLQLDSITAASMPKTPFSTVSATAHAKGVTVGPWDLIVQVGGDPPQRMHKSVWIEATDPAVAAPLRIVHLSDLHLGKHPVATDGLLSSFRTAVERVNAVKPDLVVLTGDVVEDGPEQEWMKRAHAELLGLTAPLVVIAGNHDYAHFPKVRSPRTPPDGFWIFAREFHSRRRFALSYHGWDFVGFDTGPSLFAVRVLTRGVDAETVAWLGSRVEDAVSRGRKGVVLFSHAPTRTAPLAFPDREASGLCGHMNKGGEEIEKVIEGGVDKGLSMIHLSGHTHWLELHELRPKTDPSSDRWRLWPKAEVCGPVQSGALLLNIPSATQVTFHTVKRGTRSGFGVLKLDGEKPMVETWLYDRSGTGGQCVAP